LLDEGQYLRSTHTMYRILKQEGESLERRDQLVRPPHQAIHRGEPLPSTLIAAGSWHPSRSPFRSPTYYSLGAIHDNLLD